MYRLLLYEIIWIFYLGLAQCHGIDDHDNRHAHIDKNETKETNNEEFSKTLSCTLLNVSSTSSVVIDYKQEVFNKGNENLVFRPNIVEIYKTLSKDFLPKLGRKGIIKWNWKCFTKEGDTNWTNQGCSFVRINESNHACKCTINASSNFRAKTEFAIETYDKLPAYVITLCYSFDSVSIAALFLAAITLVAFRRDIVEQNRRLGHAKGSYAVIRHFNMCFALFWVHLLVVLGRHMAVTEYTCILRALLTHFFTISGGCWMLMEGVAIYKHTLASHSLVISCATKYKNALYYSLPWLVPAAFVAVAGGISIKMGIYLPPNTKHLIEEELWRMIPEGDAINMQRKQFNYYGGCWIDKSVSLYIVGIPMILLLFPNLIISVLVSVKVWKIKKADKKTRKDLKASSIYTLTQMSNKAYVEVTSDTAVQSVEFSDTMYNRASVDMAVGVVRTRITMNSDNDSPLKVSIRSFLILIIILGVPWMALILGSVPRIRMFITGLHLITGSLQGLSIAVIFCIVVKSVRFVIHRKILIVHEKLTSIRDSIFKNAE